MTNDDVQSWLDRYVAGDQAVATGVSRYHASGDEPARTYHNVFLLRFAPDGRCAAFTELYMLEKEP